MRAPPALAVALLLLVPTGGAAQVPTLDRVDSLVAAGRYDEARAGLDRWWSARQAFDVPGSDRARAMVLRGRLQTDPAAAENDYLGVVIGHPTSPHAPEALLRLGQGLLATGQAARAAGYLQRLVADYPGRPQRTLGLLWLARAHTGARNLPAACRAARDGLDDVDDAEIAAMLRIEEAAACAIGGQLAEAPRADPAPAPPAQPARQDPAPAEARERPPPATTAGAREAPGGAFAVQTGAFRYRQGAEALMGRLRTAGYEPRLVLVPNSELMRVRVGRFATAGDAARVVTEVRRAGFDAVVVGDARAERTP